MKQVFFSIFILGLVAFTLCNCTHKSQATAIPSPAVSAQPIVDLAPQSVKGKTIVLNYANAKTRDRSIDSPWGNWSRCDRPNKTETVVFLNGNSVVKDHGEIKYTYSKKSATTAELECIEYGEDCSVYRLTFTSPNGGHAEISGFGEGMGWQTVDITFTIK